MTPLEAAQLKVAQGQLQAAWHAVYAAWGGAIANAAVVVVTCWIAVASGADARKYRREQINKTDIATAASLVEAIDLAVYVIGNGAEDPPETLVSFAWVASNAAAALQCIQDIELKAINDRDLHAAALRCNALVKGLQDSAERAQAMQKAVPVGTFVASCRHERETFLWARSIAIRTRDRLSSVKHAFLARAYQVERGVRQWPGGRIGGRSGTCTLDLRIFAVRRFLDISGRALKAPV